MEYLNSIPKFELMFWACAVPFSLIFIFQAILSFSGLDHSSADMDNIDTIESHNDLSGDSHSFPVFTFRNFVIFLMVYGWAGLAATKYGISKPVTVLGAVSLGVVMMLIVAYIFYSMTKLQESGNTDIKNALNTSGNVYIPIPAKRCGTGKIQLNIQNSLREYDAMTDDIEQISTGVIVRVSEIINNNILLVTKV